MSWLMAAIYDRFMQASEEAALRGWRRELVERTRGRVLELGAGTGLNLEHYPADLTPLLLEPDPHMRRRLRRRVRASQRPAQVLAADAAALPLAAGSVDWVVSTLVLCSVPDVAATLAEVRRVLAPEGALLFLEHGPARDRPRRLRWQRRIEPVWRRLAGNCHLLRDAGQALEEAGFALVEETRASMPKALPWVRPTVRGVARPVRA